MPDADPGVDRPIYHHHADAKENLHVAGEPRRIDQGGNVMFYESARISAFLPEMLLKGGERAEPALKFNKRSPQSGGKMQEDDPGPPEDKKPPAYHKDDKGKVNNDQEVSNDLG